MGRGKEKGETMRTLYICFGTFLLIAGCGKVEENFCATPDGRVVSCEGKYTYEELNAYLRDTSPYDGERVYVAFSDGCRIIDFSRLVWCLAVARGPRNIFLKTDEGDVQILSSTTFAGDLPLSVNEDGPLSIDITKKGILVAPGEWAREGKDVESYANRLVGGERLSNVLSSVIWCEEDADCDLLGSIACSLRKRGCHKLILLVFNDLKPSWKDELFVSHHDITWRGFSLSSSQYLKLAYTGTTHLRPGVRNGMGSPVPLAFSDYATIKDFVNASNMALSEGGIVQRVRLNDAHTIVLVRDGGEESKEVNVLGQRAMAFSFTDLGLRSADGCLQLQAGDKWSSDCFDMPPAHNASASYVRLNINCKRDASFVNLRAFLDACDRKGYMCVVCDIDGTE